MDALKSLRAQLEDLDKQILSQVASRYALVAEIKKIKDAHKLPKHQQAEFERKLAALQDFMSNSNLSKEDVEQLYKLLHEIAIKWQS